jgi:large subunit ribosomal protein L17
MQKRVKGRTLGRTASKRRALLFGITESLFTHGRIRTTEARAKEARRIADRAITTGKKGTIAARRQLARQFAPTTVKTIVDDVAPRFKDRPGGYTRIIKIAPRAGDRARLAYLELVERE